MRTALLFLAQGAAGLGLVLTPDFSYTQAPPHEPPRHADYNYARAYRHFLSSPYSARTFSSFGPGYQVETYYPGASQSHYREPSYEHQRITPRGFEHYEVVPGHGGRIATPLEESGYQVPGYERHYFVPADRYRR
jgi:hypothetical protein